MNKIQPYDYLHELPFGVGDICRVTWAPNEEASGKTIAGYIVGRDNDATHLYVSIDPEHVTEACCGEISDKRRLELGIEKIATRQIRVITPLRGHDETDFMPRARYLTLNKVLEQSACPSPAPLK